LVWEERGSLAGDNHLQKKDRLKKKKKNKGIRQRRKKALRAVATKGFYLQKKGQIKEKWGSRLRKEESKGREKSMCAREKKQFRDIPNARCGRR